MGAVVYYKNEGYVFQLVGDAIPWPIAKIGDNGEEIPLTLEEITQWRKEYRRTHPEVEKYYQERKAEQKETEERVAALKARIEEKITWWNDHPVLKSLCKPFLPRWYKYFGLE